MNRLKGLAASLLIIALLMGLPMLLLALGLPAVFTRGGGLLDLLLSPDDGSMFLGLLWCAAWLVWGFLAVTILVELISAVRRVRVPQLAALHLPQAVAHQLVSTAALLFVATSSLTPVLAHAAPPAHAPATVEPDPVSPEPAQPTKAGPVVAKTTSYVVRPGDSLWRIAERHLGAGERYSEIVALNMDLLGGKPDFLRPGWTLNLPDDQPGGTPGTVTVRRGDTLSKIAARHLGDASRWPEIHQASLRIEQPGGRHLTDPDQIDIGWTLALPTTPGTADRQPNHEQTEAGQTDAVEGEPDPDAPASRVSTPTIETSSGTREPTFNEDAVHAAPVADDVDADTDGPVASWVVAGLAGGGLLCGSLALGLARRRALQARYRRPGRAIQPTPREVAPIEKTIITRPQVTIDVQDLDATLWWTAHQHVTNGDPVPSVLAIAVTAEQITLHAATPHPVTAPWRATEDPTRWVLDRAETPLVGPDRPGTPAWPQLVSIGISDTGATWLLNLEAVGVLRLTGDPTNGTDFTRHLVAELALHPWARDVRVDCLNVCHELAKMDPLKIRPHTSDDIIGRVLAHAGDTSDALNSAHAPTLASARAGNAGYDLWPSRALIIGHYNHPNDLSALTSSILEHDRRPTGTSIVFADPDPDPDGKAKPTAGVELVLTSEGRARVALLDLDLIAVGLTLDEAQGCAAMIAAADNLDDAPIPADQPTNSAVPTDTSGNLTDPRLLDRNEDGRNAGSLLPEPDDVYLERAATTRSDLATLAPRVPAGIAAQIEDADPTLDADLAEWFGGDGSRPRLSVLGPIHARVGAGGYPLAGAKRRPYFTELLAYLWSRPHGATTGQITEALGITEERARRDLSQLREWLGTSPTTGEPHLPSALKSKAAERLGVGVYEVNDLLVDADLFKRLRARALARGEEGIADLQTALSLVEGPPFTEVRSKAGAWLVDNAEPHHLTIAIVDVAHIVHVAALADGDIARAQWAAGIANTAAPNEEIPQLDLAATADAQGLHARAQRIVDEALLGDEDEPPLEPSPRTNQIVDLRTWRTR